ncbi:hypothetical protein, partial [Mycobacterium sp.]|uniref:hypothetical protein n=1 Tax=Mycobacterium sp. TaxID=1785 RepID=UPI002BD5345E
MAGCSSSHSATPDEKTSVASPSPALPLIAASGPYPRVLPGIGSIVGITEFSGQSTQLMAAQG